MMTILVTGPIGSGKSEVCRYLASKGYPVYDCDSRCKGLYSTVPGLRERIEKELDLPFEELAVIFTDSERRMKLEGIVYPLLLDDFRTWRDSQDSPLVFMESAVALDKPLLDGSYDRVLFVTGSLENRIRRNPKAALRDRLQNFDQNRMDWKVENNSSIQSLHDRIDSILNQITK